MSRFSSSLPFLVCFSLSLPLFSPFLIDSSLFCLFVLGCSLSGCCLCQALSNRRCFTLTTRLFSNENSTIGRRSAPNISGLVIGCAQDCQSVVVIGKLHKTISHRTSAARTVHAIFAANYQHLLDKCISSCQGAENFFKPFIVNIESKVPHAKSKAQE